MKSKFINQLCKCKSLSGNCIRIALILIENKYTQKEICDNYGYKKAAVSTTIKKLLDWGIIEKEEIHNSVVYYSDLNWTCK